MEDRETRLKRLLEKASRLTRDPGVYLMKDAQGRVVYIGKSAALRDRVSSYFQPSTKLEPRKAPMLDVIEDFEIIGSDSEVEALLVENRLIKDIQPKFNARLMDDKTFPYLEVTTGEDFPGIYVTREPRSKGVKLYGPFTSVYQLKEAVTHLQKAFKFRTCHLNIVDGDEKRKFFRPCLLYAIDQCTAPCADKVSKEAYCDDIRRTTRFLDGERKGVLAELERDMRNASKDMNFELAAKIRDELKALQALGKRAAKGDQEYWQPEAFVSNPIEGVQALQDVLGLAELPRVIEGFDIAHLQGGEMVGSMVCFIDGVPFKNGYRRFKIKHGQGNNDFLSLQEVVSRRYREAGQSHELYPNLIMIDGGIGQLNAAMDAFRLMDVKPPAVISLAKKEELIYSTEQSEPFRLPRNNLGLKLVQYVRDEAHRFAQHYHHILRRKAQLEEDVKAGKRPPRKRVVRPKADAGEMPLSTIASLPILKKPVEESADSQITPDSQNASDSQIAD